MSSRLGTSFSVTWALNKFTITYASTYSPQVLADSVTLTPFNTYYLDVDGTTLDCRKCTSPASATGTLLSTNMVALIGPFTFNGVALTDTTLVNYVPSTMYAYQKETINVSF